ncbi:hypothetical protein [Cystobacter ferrugineus]|uniref:Lipoprotein n=1 Tax=Cystobacter ferrugineus TaxID=83449 RepID=A0A1L9BFS0_9BACT|nr:hypothetical protein [Cystobacter ferrugineus]OJH41100.1 hypothetical protein BON30_09375 [Cystobacter ferrugineus]
MRHTLAMLCCLLSTGCLTTTPAAYTKVPKERATECVTNCEELGMKLTGVVIIRNSAGCVCEPKDSEMKVSTGAVSTAVGGEIIAVEEEEAASVAQRSAPQTNATSPRN